MWIKGIGRGRSALQIGGGETDKRPWVVTVNVLSDEVG